MNISAKTIQIFLPTGLRLAEITTRIVQVVEIPRAELDAFVARILYGIAETSKSRYYNMHRLRLTHRVYLPPQRL